MEREREGGEEGGREKEEHKGVSTPLDRHRCKDDQGVIID